MSTRIGNNGNNEFGIFLGSKENVDPEHVKRNRAVFFSEIGIQESFLAYPVQCHSKDVLKVNEPGEYKNCDGLITNAMHVALAVATADCVPILLFDPLNKAIGAVHAGWRGTVGRIAARAVKMMEAEYGTDPAKILAYIGPSAGACCYEVSEEVAIKFGNKIVPYSPKAFLDLKKENMSQLIQLGAAAGNIEVSSSCTICEKELFHSFRRDGLSAGRMTAIICIE